MLSEKELLEKYNIPVPRYTSYPPANFFTEEFNATLFQTAISESNKWLPENISFYFHIPFCKKLCYFCGCNSYGMRNKSSVDDYMQALMKELQMVIGQLDKTRKVSQIHYGGGTPNAIDISYLKTINELIFKNFDLVDHPEIAIECNPAYLSEVQIKELKDAGFKRFSLGVQDFNKAVLDAVNREEPFMELGEIIKRLKANDPEVEVNLDFIYGLPKQTSEQFEETIRRAAKLKPERLVTFSYAHVPWVSKIQKKLEVYGLPENSEKIKMNAAAQKVMKENGYHAIGMDHYALKNDELYIAQKNHSLSRNFQGYCTQRTTGQVYAIGVTGISQLGQVYAQNTKSIEDYIHAIRQGKYATIKGYRLSNEQVIVREIISELMCNYRIDFSVLKNRFHLADSYAKNILSERSRKLNDLVENQIIEINDEVIAVTERGKMYVRNVASVFDPLFGTGAQKFSKPV